MRIVTHAHAVIVEEIMANNAEIKLIGHEDRVLDITKVPALNWGEFPQSQQSRYISCHGQSRITIVCCECQTTGTYYLWSMAGHGMGKCKGCGAMISYIGLHTVPATLYKAVITARKKFFKNR